MERKLIISEQPRCKICSKPMKEWNPFSTEHEHIECTSERVSASLIESLKLNTINLGEKLT